MAEACVLGALGVVGIVSKDLASGNAARRYTAPRDGQLIITTQKNRVSGVRWGFSFEKAPPSLACAGHFSLGACVAWSGRPPSTLKLRWLGPISRM